MISTKQRFRSGKARILCSLFLFLLPVLGDALLAERPRTIPTETVSKELDLEHPIELAIRYVLNHCDENGRFSYVVRPDSGRIPDAIDPNEYNQLRHAGTLYSLAQAYRWAEIREKRELQADILNVMRRAGVFMLQRIGPTPSFDFSEDSTNDPTDRPAAPVFALWSPKEEIDSGLELGRMEKTLEMEAKLGGAGLALLSLCPMRRIEPESVSKETVAGLGRFIRKLTLSDGSTIGSIDGRGRVKTLVSLYSPGEAALGLLDLEMIDSENGWQDTAERILVHLAQTGQGTDSATLDHWAVLATEKLFWVAGRGNLQTDQAEELLIRHTEKVSKTILAEQIVPENGFEKIDPALLGAFCHSGATCGTATRLEALAAALNVLPGMRMYDPVELYGDEQEIRVRKERQELRQSIYKARNLGLQFLLRHQIQEGPAKGGISQAVVPLPVPADPVLAKTIIESNKAIGLIRIDYVQHFLSAMIRYDISSARLIWPG